jgi:hypothetical protein
MAGSQPQYGPTERHDSSGVPPAVPSQFQQQPTQRYEQPRFDARPQQHEPQQQRPYVPSVRKVALTAAEGFWYVLMCIGFGAGYFAKIPVKKALSDFGMAEMTAAEKFWYVVMCIGFGAGYFAKVPVAKAISEMPQFRMGGYAQPDYR